MKAVLLSNSDGKGGAYVAVYRLHQGLQRIGVDSTLVVNQATRQDRTVVGPPGRLGGAITKLAAYLDRLPPRMFSGFTGSHFSPALVPDRVFSRVRKHQPSIVNIHWITGGFLRIESLRRLRWPLVWTLHDMWPFTGGCHYAGTCERYLQRCGRCPLLSSQRDCDLSRAIWWRKSRAWSDTEFTIVAPSRWLASRARDSSLFQGRRIEVIPYGVPLDRYRPVSKAIARDLLGLPQDRRVIAFGAVASTKDFRKGYDLLVEALGRLTPRDSAPTIAVVFGASAPPPGLELTLPSWFLGQLHDDLSLALVYSAADVFVAPSREDNLPNTVLEATACGTPTVAFAVGGLPDIIEHNRSGYLARPFDAADLAHGVQLLVDSPDVASAWGERARARAEAEYGLERQARRYLDLYREVLAGGGLRK